MKNWSLSTFVLLFANLLVLGFAVFYNLRFYDLIMIYWSETVIIGFFNIIKMLICAKSPELPKELVILRSNITPYTKGENIIFLILFPIHFFAFCFAFAKAIEKVFLPDHLPTSDLIINLDISTDFLLAGLVLFISHGISFFIHFIGKREYVYTDMRSLQGAPYKKLMTLQVFIFGGGWVLEHFGGHSLSLTTVFISGKIMIDIWQHNIEHKAELDLEKALNKPARKKGNHSTRKKRKR